MPTIIQSVTLSTGEQFTLPPGAILISTTNNNAITSTCDIPDNLEETACYVARFILTDDEGTDRVFREGASTRIEGFYLNGVYTGFASAYTPNDTPGLFDNALTLLAELKSKLPSILDYNSGTYQNSASNSGMTYFQIKTIPSVATTLTLYATSYTGTGLMPVFIPFQLRTSEFDDLTNMPNCP